MFNQLIFTFIIYYIIFIIHVLQHIYFYELFFSIYYPKFVSYYVRHNYATITILELVSHFSSKIMRSPPSSHITKLMNLRDIPEVFQHARTAKKMDNDYYHISAPYTGYDSFSLIKAKLQKILIEKDIDLVTFYEKKVLFGNVSKYRKLETYRDKYSRPSTEEVPENNYGARPSTEEVPENTYGARPGHADQLEFGTILPKDYNILQTMLKNAGLSKSKKPSIIIEDYSDTYVKVVLDPKHGGLGKGTIISDSAFEDLKCFYDFLENNEEMCSYMNDLLEENPFFPL